MISMQIQYGINMQIPTFCDQYTDSDGVNIQIQMVCDQYANSVWGQYTDSDSL